MTEQLLQKADQLRASLHASSAYQTLLVVEANLEASEEINQLSTKFHRLEQEFNDAIDKYGLHHSQAQAIQGQLFIAKKALDEHPLVREYNEAYKAVNRMLLEIQRQVFAPFSSHSCGAIKV